MATDNRRVAAYLPPELDNRLKEFIAEKGLKGDSPALIAILSEYFGVSQRVNPRLDYSLFITQDQFSELASKVSDLAKQIEESSSSIRVLSELPDKMKQMADRLEDIEAFVPPVSSTESSKVDSYPGQMDLLSLSQIDKPGNSSSESFSLPPQNLRPMNGQELSSRFGLSPNAVGNNKLNWWKTNPDRFMKWTKDKDPDNIPWRYNPDDKLYYPMLDGLPVG